MVRLRVRIRFSKQGDLRLIGHRDLMRCLERLFRRAGLALSFSEGFHPKPRMTFPLALAVGIEGVDEVMEFELAETITAEELLRRLTPQAPPGLVFRAVEVLPEGSKKASVQSVSYEAPIPAPRPSRSGRADRASAGRLVVADRARRTGARRSTCVRSCRSWRCDEGVLKMRLRVDSRGSVGPREVLAALGLTDLERQGVASAPHRRGDLRMSRLRCRLCRAPCFATNAYWSVLPNKKATR